MKSMWEMIDINMNSLGPYHNYWLKLLHIYKII